MMAAPKKLKQPVYVTTVLEETQHEALRRLAYESGRPMAELIREVLDRELEKAAAEARNGRVSRRTRKRRAA
jgi:hypothetical protein